MKRPVALGLAVAVALAAGWTLWSSQSSFSSSAANAAEKDAGAELLSATLTGTTMGTTYTIKLVAPRDQADPTFKGLKTVIDKRLAGVNKVMSTWDPSSELSLFNKNTSTQPVTISAELATVVKESLALSRLSDGAFDVTVGPAVNAWGFGPRSAKGKKDRVLTLPKKGELKEMAKYVGFKKLTLKENSLTKADARVYVDLSAIAKGYGVDEVAKLLDQRQIDRYMIEIGGEMRVSGTNGQDRPWQVGIEKPSPGSQGEIAQIVPLTNMAVATSGSYRNFIKRGGKQFSHTIDPKTLTPIQHNVVSVTVFHPSAMLADGLATALMALGPEKGLALARKEQIPAYYIVKDGDEFKSFGTATFSDDGKVKAVL